MPCLLDLGCVRTGHTVGLKTVMDGYERLCAEITRLEAELAKAQHGLCEHGISIKNVTHTI